MRWVKFLGFQPGLEPEKQLVSGAFAAGVTCILCLDQFTAGCGGTVATFEFAQWAGNR